MKRGLPASHQDRLAVSTRLIIICTCFVSGCLLTSGDNEISLGSKDNVVFATSVEDHIQSAAEAQAVNKIVFSSDRDGDNEIYTVDTDGTGLTKLTNNTIGDYEPEWSPLGNKIAFSSNQDGNQEIYIMNDDGTNRVRLTDNPAHDWDPAWSPDGSKIAFISDRDGISQLWEMQSNGNNPEKVSLIAAAFPAYSPDGSTIAFVSPNTAPQTDTVYIISSDRSYLKEVISGHDLGKIAWSPDGLQIAVPGTMQSTLVIFNTDGSQSHSYNRGKYDPTWSPDGNMICYFDCSTTPPGLVVAYDDNSGRIQITNTIDSHPSWR